MSHTYPIPISNATNLPAGVQVRISIAVELGKPSQALPAGAVIHASEDSVWVDVVAITDGSGGFGYEVFTVDSMALKVTGVMYVYVPASSVIDVHLILPAKGKFKL